MLRSLQSTEASLLLHVGSEWRICRRSPARSSIHSTSILAAVRAKSRLVSIHSPQTIHWGAVVLAGLGLVFLA